jgi:hypothetical protein
MTLPLTYVEAPARTPRPNTSLDVLPVHEVSNSHFVGFTFHADPCAFPNALPKDCYIQIGSAAGTAKTFGDTGNDVNTQVFGVYQGIECFLNGGIEDFVALAGRVLENGEWRVVDGALAAQLATLATATTPATTTSIVTAIGILEQYLAAQVPGQGYLFMGPLAATFAASQHLLLTGIGGELTTYLGTPVVVLTEPSMGNVMYASGPVNIWRGPVVANRAPDVTHNLGRGIAERLYSIAIECKAYKITFTAPAAQSEEPEPEPGTPLTILLGSIPSSPIPDGADATIIAQTNVVPTAEVFLHYQVNGGAEVTAGEMTQINPHEFVWEVQGDTTTTGDSVELWAVSEFDGNPVESNHITIEVT